MEGNSTDSPGNNGTRATRKRDRESLGERREKSRVRKRRKRGHLLPEARQRRTYSTSSTDCGIPMETAGNPAGRIYPFNAEALERLQQKLVTAGRPIPRRFREITSAVEPAEEGEETSMVVDSEGVDAAAMSVGEPEDGGATTSARNRMGNTDKEEGHNTAAAASGIANEEGPDALVEQQLQLNLHGNSGDSSTNSNHVLQNSCAQGSQSSSDNEDPQEDSNDEARNQRRNTEEEEARIRRELSNLTDMEKLAIDAAGVRGSSFASNASLDKMFSVVFKHMETVRKLHRRRSKKKTYSNKLRRLATKYVPEVRTDLL